MPRVVLFFPPILLALLKPEIVRAEGPATAESPPPTSAQPAAPMPAGAAKAPAHHVTKAPTSTTQSPPRVTVPTAPTNSPDSVVPEPAAPTAPEPRPPAAPEQPVPASPASQPSPQQALAPATTDPIGSSGGAADGARVRIAVDHPGAWLETRPFGALDEWSRQCAAPCGQWVVVDGREVRVVAEGMTPTAPFRIESGTGAALLAVNGGSSVARTWGRLGLAVGTPTVLLGMTGFAYGTFDDRAGLKVAGAATLGLGAALVLVALPLLVSGSTSVRNEKGELIAARLSQQSF